MGYINQSVSVNSDEKVFIKTFIEQLTQADSRITCDTDIDAQFANTSNNPTFTVNFGTNSKIVFTRDRPLGTYMYSYELKVFINNTSDTISLGLCSGSSNSNDTKIRTWKFTVAANANTLYLSFGGFDTVMPTSAQLSVMSISDGEFSATGYAKSANSLGSNFTVTSQLNNGLAYSFANRVNYTLANSKIEVIKNKSLLDSGGSKILTFDGLYDCSTIPQFVNFKIDKSNYFSIGTHTLMPI